jgi:hypothetical protein
MSSMERRGYVDASERCKGSGSVQSETGQGAIDPYVIGIAGLKILLLPSCISDRHCPLCSTLEHWPLYQGRYHVGTPVGIHTLIPVCRVPSDIVTCLAVLEYYDAPHPHGSKLLPAPLSHLPSSGVCWTLTYTLLRNQLTSEFHSGSSGSQVRQGCSI